MSLKSIVEVNMMNKTLHIGVAAMVSASLLIGGFTQEGGVQSVGASSSSKSVQQNLIQSIASQARPFKTTDPTKSLDDLKPLKNMIGSARYVGLGESTHGSSEIFNMKFRLVKYLVTEMGFTNFGLEEDWGVGLKVNEYIQTGKGDPRKLLRLLYPTDEHVAMLKWMKDYNANPANKKKIQFVGLDLKALDETVFNKVINYVKQHHPEVLDEVKNNYTELAKASGNLQGYVKLTPEERKSFNEQARKVVQLLDKVTKQGSAESNTSELVWVKATARVIENFTSMTIPSDYTGLIKLHEQYLADNVIWAQTALGGKTIFSGHNTHVAKGIVDKKLYPYVAGKMLKERLGDQYVIMGSTTSEGKFTLYREYDPNTGNGKLSTYEIPKNVNSFNYTLGKVSHDKYLLDLRHLHGKAKSWVQEKRKILSAGAQVFSKDDLYYDASLKEQFDIIFHIRKTSPSHIK